MSTLVKYTGNADRALLDGVEFSKGQEKEVSDRAARKALSRNDGSWERASVEPQAEDTVPDETAELVSRARDLGVPGVLERMRSSTLKRKISEAEDEVARIEEASGGDLDDAADEVDGYDPFFSG